LEFPNRRRDGVEFVVRDHVAFVQQEDVTELDLIDENLRQRPLGRRRRVRERRRGVERLPEPVGIDHRDGRIEAESLGETPPVGSLGQGPRDGNGFADAGGFDDEVVEGSFLGEAGHFGHEVVLQATADTAVREVDDAVLAGPVQQFGVDVHLAHVVDDDGDASVPGVVQQPIDQRRLAGAEWTANDSHRNRFRIVRHDDTTKRSDAN
jgi:hypothetical protein